MEARTGILKNFATLILAAGFSGRMGIPKLSLRFDESRSFAEKIIQTYQSAGCENIVMVVNSEGKKFLKQQKPFLSGDTVSVILNKFPERERFYSLQTGMKVIRGGMPVFIQNIDNPLIGQPLLQKMVAVFKPGNYVVPRYNGHGGHPVLLSQEIVRHLAALPDWRQNLRNFLQAYPQISCPVEDKNILININTPEEYAKFFKKSDR